MPAAPAVVSATGGGTILALDDEDGMLRSLVRALSTEYEVVTCSDAREAWRRVEGGERFDVIFCDLAMPHIGGVELSRLIDTLDPEQGRRLVFITGGALDSATAAFLQQSPLEQLEKPVSTQALRTVARRYINRANRVPTRV